MTGKMSRTLQQMLGNDFDVVFMHEAGGALGDAQLIAQLVEGVRTTEFVYAGYGRVYVEARVSRQPPPATTTATGAAASVVPLYKAAAHFVEAEAARARAARLSAACAT